MKKIQPDLDMAFITAKMRLRACSTSPLDPSQKMKIDAADEAIREYLGKVDSAFKLSKKSTLHFVKTKLSHTR